MPELKRQPVQYDHAADDDPLVELARIVSEGTVQPAAGRPLRGPAAVAPDAGHGRAAIVRQAMPQQLSALEQELFSELRSSVDPERNARVRVEPVMGSDEVTV